MGKGKQVTVKPFLDMNYSQDELSLKSLINDADSSPCESSLLHSYPASMPAFLASRLIKKYTTNDDCVFDPFCGTGVVLIEGLRLNRNCIGTDLQESVIRIITASINIPESNILWSVWGDIRKSAYSSISMFGERYEKSSLNSYEFLRPWFHWKTFEMIMAIHAQIIKIHCKKTQEIFLLLLAGSLISMSKRRERGIVHWGWVADNVIPKQDELVFVDSFKVFNDRLTKIISFVNSLDSCNLIEKSKNTLSMLQHNWLKCDDNLLNEIIKPVDLLLTSPPYPYSIDYSLALRLTNYLLGYDFNNFRKKEIGARYKRKRKNRSYDYLYELGISLKMASRFVKINGYVVLILPDPIDYPNVLDFDVEAWLGHLQAKLAGEWRLVDFAHRNCQHRRVINSNQKVKNEIVAVYQRKFNLS